MTWSRDRVGARIPGIPAALSIALQGVPTVDFTHDIVPILAARCYQCHGPDAASRKAGLRLDRRDAAIAVPRKPGSRPAIAPGDPEGSELLARVTSADSDERMPPAEVHPALTGAEIAAIRAWIAAGAEYGGHWSWKPLPPPDSLAARAAAAGDSAASPLRSRPAPEQVDAAAWLRRVTFDLTGLPPTVDDCRSFAVALQDARTPSAVDAARGRVVDALLASPRYGERWGRHWMDVMRFSETHGHEYDYPVEEAWRWRDWVIRAFNDDVPYARFVREQVAGDLLPESRRNPDDGTDEGVTATGWWWMTQGTHAPVDVRLDQAERIDNQIDVASKAFLGTTASCARCHDHKFDDISQADYYALFGVVRSSRRTYAYQDPHGAIGRAVQQLQRMAEAALAVDGPAVPAPASPSAAPPGVTWSFDGGTFEGWTASGWAFGGAPLAPGTRIAPEGRAPMVVPAGCAHSGRLSDRLQGTLRSPTFTVPKGPIRVRCHGSKARIRLIVDGYFLDDRNPLLFDGFIQAVDHPAEWRTHEWVTGRYAGETAYLEIADDGDGFVAVDWVALAELPDASCAPSPAPVPGVAVAPAGAQAPEPGSAPGTGTAQAAIEIPAPVRVLAMEDGTGMDSPLYARGMPRNAGEVVPRGMIRSLRTVTDSPQGDLAGSGRRELAEELVSPANPLTWRVAANRAWHLLTGRGIVPSTDDFGVLGQPPGDQELLDYLAMRLRAHQSMKALVREIVLSPAYGSASRPVRRLDAEALRDATIAVCGGLDLAMGGPSVPVHLTDSMQGRGRPGRSGPLDGARRRSVYQEVRRNFLPPFMLVFDQPIPTTTVGSRPVSNVPAQGLALMNDPFVRGQAERWGQALAAEVDVDALVRRMHLVAYGRPAAAEEVARCLAFLGASPDAAVWSDLAHAMLLSSEFRYLR